MRAATYRLRFVSGVSFPGATYGTSNFGGPITYGQRASDLLAAYRYRVMPIPAGWPTQPAWIRRMEDLAPPMQAQILSDVGPLDLSAVAEGHFVLTPMVAGDPYVLDLTVTDALNGIVSHTWTEDVCPPAGQYRVVVWLVMTSGRRFMLPPSDDLQMTVVPIMELVDG